MGDEEARWSTHELRGGESFELEVLSDPRDLKEMGPVERLMRTPWAWIVAWIGGWLNIGRVSATVDPFVFMALAFAAVTLPGILWSYPAWSNRGVPARGLAFGLGRFYWPYPWMFHAGSGRAPAVERNYRHRIPKEWVYDGIHYGKLQITGVWKREGAGVALLALAGGASLTDDLEPSVHQIAVSDGRQEHRVCKCTDPSMRLVPVMRVLNFERGNSPSSPVVVAREVGAGGP